VTGKQAHAALPDTGIDALEAANGILADLYASRAELARVKSRVARHIDGDAQRWPGPRWDQHQCGCQIRSSSVSIDESFRRRHRPKSRRRSARVLLRRRENIRDHRRYQSRAACLSARAATRRRPHHRRDPGACAPRARTDVPVQGVPLFTDARHYAERGIPIVLYGAGPPTLIEARDTTTDENLRLSDLRAATRIVAAAVGDLLSEGA